MTVVFSSLLAGAWLLVQERPRHGRRCMPRRASNNDPTTTTTVSSLCVLRPRITSDEENDWYDQRLTVAQELSRTLSLPSYTLDELQSRQTDETTPPRYAVVVEPFPGSGPDYAIGLQSLQMRRGKKGKVQCIGKPWFVDFSSISQRRGGDTDDLLTKKAVRPTSTTRVVDLTAGWGQDAWLVSQAGAAHVTMVERNPVVAALLRDGLRRSGTSKMDLRIGDGTEVAQEMRQAQEPVDVVYLDPMFPARKNSASVKKNMQILHILLDSQVTDFEEERLAQEAALLQQALALASVKVVVKRPIHAPCFGGSKLPDYAVRGSVNRWDVYLRPPPE